jgi:hypothetical protein
VTQSWYVAQALDPALIQKSPLNQQVKSKFSIPLQNQYLALYIPFETTDLG